MDDGQRIMYIAILGGACFLAGNGWISVTDLNAEIEQITQKGGKRKTRRKKRN
jgi:hypothetical protein